MVIRRRGRRRTDYIHDHAVRHLQKQTFSCSYCEFQTSRKDSVKRHIVTKHVEPVVYVKDEIMVVVDRCFGGQSRFRSPKPKRNSVLQTSTKRSTTKTIGAPRGRRGNNPAGIYWCCVKLAKKFPKDGFISCRRCAKRISVEPFLGGPKMISHVNKAHLKRPLFSCGHCEKSFYTYPDVASHLRGVHFCSATGNYIDHRKKYESDIIDVLSKCFSFETTSNEEEKDQHDKIVQRKGSGYGEAVNKETVEAVGTSSESPNNVENGRYDFRCDRCDYITNYPKLIENHKKLMHARGRASLSAVH